MVDWSRSHVYYMYRYMVGDIWLSLQLEADENDVYGERGAELPLSHKTMRLSIL